MASCADDDETCSYGCLAIEYLYWTLQSLLGYQDGDNAPPGLNSGDVITSVNGQSVSDPASAQSALAAAAASGNAQVQILRNGRTITVTVPTR